LSTKSDKWHEYGTTPYEFPEMWNSCECGDFYDAEYVKDWFKRCVDDYPPADYGVKTDTGDYGVYCARADWFEKWFNQFIVPIKQREEEE